jgi:hypothetical protein
MGTCAKKECKGSNRESTWVLVPRKNVSEATSSHTDEFTSMQKLAI